MLGTIQFSNYDGSNIGLFHQDASKYFFGVTLDRYLVFFGDWMNNSISYAHKSDVDSPVLLLKDSLTPIAKGLELVTPNKQPTSELLEIIDTLGIHSSFVDRLSSFGGYLV